MNCERISPHYPLLIPPPTPVDCLLPNKSPSYWFVCLFIYSLTGSLSSEFQELESVVLCAIKDAL